MPARPSMPCSPSSPPWPRKTPRTLRAFQRRGERTQTPGAARIRSRPRELLYVIQAQAYSGGSMESKRGIPVSPGVAIGPALVLDTEGFRIPQRFIDLNEAEAEVERLHDALAAAAEFARHNQQAVTEKLGPQYGAVFGAHALDRKSVV